MKTPTDVESKSFDLSLTGLPAIDMHKEKASRESSAIRVGSNITGAGSSFDIDINTWLEPASRVYNTSPDIRDYIIVPVPVNISELPNTNGDAFSKREWLRFNVDEGRLAFQTFKAKPTFIEHANSDHTKAMGIIFDSHISTLQGFQGDHVRLTLLLGFDRTRCPERVERILNGELNTYSKGTTYKAYECSICGQIVTPKQRNFCQHTSFNKPAYLDPRTGKLVYRDCIGLRGFECSSVDDPAFACAASYSDHLMRIEK